MVSKPQMIGQSPSLPEVSLEPEPTALPLDAERPVEIGGREGLEPTRYGDWEKNGRCIDF